MPGRIYMAIDLKSFYASVECVERGLDPLTCNLVVADAARTEKTICLAVSPALKAYGIPGRPRLFQVAEQVKAINAQRRAQAPGRRLGGGQLGQPGATGAKGVGPGLSGGPAPHGAVYPI